MAVRRRLPAELLPPYEAFRRLIPVLERAKTALAASVPGARLPGRPLAEALLEFEDGLREVRACMDAWRAPEVEDAWLRASRGLDRATALADRVRLEGREPAGFEELIALVGDLLEPLDAFSSASERFRELRA